MHETLAFVVWHFAMTSNCIAIALSLVAANCRILRIL